MDWVTEETGREKQEKSGDAVISKKKKKTYFHSNFAVWAFRILMGSRLPSRKIKDGWNMFENLSLLELISERRKVNIAIHPQTVEEISPTTWVMMIKELTVI